MKPELKMINQGTYGCVFRPSLLCSGKVGKSRKYISKVQLKKRTSENETNIGEAIRKINRYPKHFAPVIKTCDVNLAVIDDQEIKQCDFLKTSEQQNHTYETNKIRYIGPDTLVDYFQTEADDLGKTPTFFKKLVSSYLVLLESIRKLVSAKIIHFDLKENNIMCKAKTGRPIIIDFGLSIMADTLDSQLQDKFFAYAPEYYPWCIDICILSYIANELRSQRDFLERNVVIEDFDPILNKFIESNFIHSTMFDANEQKQFKADMQTYLRKIMGGNFIAAPTWKMVSDALLLQWATWDNYSLACIYLEMISDFGLNSHLNGVGFTKEFLVMLKSIVLAPPDSRKSVNDTLAQTSRLFNRVDSKSSSNLQHKIVQTLQIPEQIVMRSRKIMASKRDTVMREKQVY
jgi:serine/threonine protein kinase